MFKRLKNNKAQINMVEYAMLFFLIAGMTIAMSTFFRRSVQGRMRDARIHMYKTVLDKTDGMLIGNQAFNAGGILVDYETYYTNTVSLIDTRAAKQTFLSAGGSSGIFEEQPNDITLTFTNSITAPPKDGD